MHASGPGLTRAVLLGATTHLARKAPAISCLDALQSSCDTSEALFWQWSLAMTGMVQMVLRADKDWAKKMVGSTDFEEWIKNGEGELRSPPPEACVRPHILQ